MSYYPLSTRQVLEEALIRCSCSQDLLGDLTEAANRYNQLWLELERSAESIDALRAKIMSALLENRSGLESSTHSRLSKAYDDVRHESGVLAYPGVTAFLKDLKSTYKLGLYTNGPSFLQWEKIESLGFDQLFDTIVVAGDVDIYKPDPRAFSLLLDKLDVAADQSMFVGDNFAADVEGAHNAGMVTAWIKHNQDDEIDGVQSDAGVSAHSVQPTFVVSEATLLREVLL